MPVFYYLVLHHNGDTNKDLHCFFICTFQNIICPWIECIQKYALPFSSIHTKNLFLSLPVPLLKFGIDCMVYSSSNFTGFFFPPSLLKCGSFWPSYHIAFSARGWWYSWFDNRKTLLCFLIPVITFWASSHRPCNLC